MFTGWVEMHDKEQQREQGKDKHCWKMCAAYIVDVVCVATKQMVASSQEDGSANFGDDAAKTWYMPKQTD